MFGDGRQVPMFREVLSKESVDALVQHMLPVGIRMREVDASLKVTGHSLMVDKFQTIVIGDGIHPVLIQGEALCDHVTNSLGRLSEARTDDGIRRFALDQRHQGAPPRWPLPITVSPSQSLPRRGDDGSYPPMRGMPTFGSGRTSLR